jgi:hypothetical protein
MSLWSNTDADTSAPKTAAACGVGGHGVSANGLQLYANTTTDAFVTNMKIGMFGVSPDEKVGTGNVSSFSVENGGDSAYGVPTVTVTGANTTQATTTVNVKIDSVTIRTAGTGYANGNTFLAYVGANTTAGVLTVTNVDGNGNVLAVAITTAGKYSTITTANNYNFPQNTASGNGFTANLRFAVESVTVNNAGEAYNRYTVGTSVTGNGIANASVGVILTGQEGTDKAALAGWNLRREGTGGRAGRVHYECIVAMGSITGDGADDTQLAP